MRWDRGGVAASRVAGVECVVIDIPSEGARGDPRHGPGTVPFRPYAMACDGVMELVLRPNRTIGHDRSVTCDRSKNRPKIGHIKSILRVFGHKKVQIIIFF